MYGRKKFGYKKKSAYSRGFSAGFRKAKRIASYSKKRRYSRRY